MRRAYSLSCLSEDKRVCCSDEHQQVIFLNSLINVCSIVTVVRVLTPLLDFTMPISTTQQQASPLTPSAYVETTLKYSSFPEISPKEKYYIHIDDTDKKNFVNVDIPTKVYDLRGQEASTHIDTTGFQALTSPSDVSAELLLTGSDEEVAQVYYPEVEALLKEHTGASRVVFFDHTIRKPHPPEVPESPSTRRPVIQVHVDQTPASAHRRVERHVQPPQPYKRFQIINVWRPIQNTVYDYPLGVCEWNTLDVVNDLIPTTLVYAPPTPAGETYGVRYNENYRYVEFVGFVASIVT